MPLTVGTAGHIDHGKTWLVRALTGKNTDRLPEERERGISIDLGYAPLELPDGRRLSVVDVPGHERFVRTMVAGATGIDAFLLVIDANEGARPQTLEHLQILRLLGVDRGVVALTKSDLVDEETLELARLEAEELVPGAPVVAVSARSGDGLDELRAAIASVAEERARDDAPTRLYVDRVFTLRGIGTVATGTLWSGSIGEGDVLRVELREALVHAPVRAAELRRIGVEVTGEWAFSQQWLDELRAQLERALASADPLDPGVPVPSEPWADEIVPLLGLERRGAKLYRPGATAELGAREQAARELEATLGLEPVKVEDAALARFLEQQGRLVRLGDGYAVSRAAYDDAAGALVDGITLAQFRDRLGVGRKTAQLYLERFDSDGLTRRVGDVRVLRRRR